MREGGGSSREGPPTPVAIRTLHRRDDFLATLSDGPLEKRQLIDELEVSRSTVDRAIDELRTEGFVRAVSDGFVLTQYGRLCRRFYRQFARNLGTVSHAADSLQRLPLSTRVDPVFFRDADVVSERTDGDRLPGAVIRDLLERAEEFWTLTGSSHFELISTARRRVVEEGMQFNLIHSVDTVERLRLHFPEVLESTLRSGNLDLYCLEQPPPLGLIKAATAGGETVGLVLYGQRGESETIVVTESCAAADRFDELFGRRRDEASSVDLADDGSPVIG